MVDLNISEKIERGIEHARWKAVRPRLTLRPSSAVLQSNRIEGKSVRALVVTKIDTFARVLDHIPSSWVRRWPV